MIDIPSYRKIELMKGCKYCEHSKYILVDTNTKLVCVGIGVEPDFECKNFKFKDAGKKKVKNVRSKS
jgi:hypothetical protein